MAGTVVSINDGPMGPGASLRALRSAAPAEPRGWSAGVVPALAAALTGAFLWLALYAQPAQRRPVSAAVSAMVMALLIAVTTSLVRLPGLGGAERRSWSAMRVAFVMFLVSSLAGLVSMTGAVATPDWVIPTRQLMLVAGFGTLVFALFRLPAAPVKGLAKARFLLDSATIFASSTVFLWHFVIGPRLSQAAMSGREAVLVVAAVGFLAVFVGALGMLLLREHTPGTRQALIRLVLGMAMIFGVIVMALGRLGTTIPPSLWTIALNWAAYVLIVSAAVQQRRHALGAEYPDRDVEHRLLLALPYVAVALAFGFLLRVGLGEAPLELRGVLVSASVVGVCVLARQRLLLHENELLRRRLEEQASVDDLTGLRNRRAWMAEADREIAKARRSDTPVSLLALDLDNFKTVNDRCGHAAGDLVLRAIAAVLREGVRAADLPARIGGDEFVVLLPDTAQADAIHLAHALSLRLGRLAVPEAAGVDVTVSIGVASLSPGGTLHELVAVADSAMYAAKRDESQRVHAAQAPLSVVTRPSDAARARMPDAKRMSR